MAYFRLFDVDHGLSAFFMGDDGETFLFDCGRDSRTGHGPSKWLSKTGFRKLDTLVISHFDEDHVADLPNVVATQSIGSLACNRSVAPLTTAVQKLEGGPLTPAMRIALRTQSVYSGALITRRNTTAVSYFSVPYPLATDQNNLSLVTFVTAGSIRIVLPGDLERAGWNYLLRQEAFRAQLRQVNVFVASHHGRENGFVRDVFDHCSPEIVLFSDGPIQYDSQLTTARYASVASGVRLTDGKYRYVYSTRKDGDIVIHQRPSAAAWIWSEPS